jgi:hypothetical protein
VLLPAIFIQLYSIIVRFFTAYKYNRFCLGLFGFRLCLQPFFSRNGFFFAAHCGSAAIHQLKHATDIVCPVIVPISQIFAAAKQFFRTEFKEAVAEQRNHTQFACPRFVYRAGLSKTPVFSHLFGINLFG